MKRILFAVAIANVLAGSNADRVLASEPNAGSEASSESVAGDERGMSLDPLLSAIEQLESDHGARCQSSAGRFEDSIFGTPLSEAARSASVELQVDLVRALWARASVVALQQGASTIQPRHLRPEIEKVVGIDRSAEGEWRAAFPGVAPIAIPQIRATHYASIAYSLRAILAVQQNFMVLGGAPLLDLEPKSIDEIRNALDVVALSALLLADRAARERSKDEIGEPEMRAAWAELFPGTDGKLAMPDSAGRIDAPASAEGRARALALLDEIVARKSAAYRNYNQLDDREEIRLLVFNISRFYARQPVSSMIDERRKLIASFENQLDAFAGELLREAERRARRAGDPLIRRAEAMAATQQLIPSEIDEFEDVHVFGRLSQDEQITLEVFECDSFRDFATHWRSLRRAAHAVPSDSVLPDPFAAEVLAEGISQYGVLLLRVAGVIARESDYTVRLRPVDIEAAAPVIRERARRHHDTPEASEARSRIASAPNQSGEVDAKGFFSDVTAEVGVDFIHRSSSWLGAFRHKQLKTPPTFSGGGVAAEDVDGDSDIDLLFVGGAGNALLLNDGRGAFSNATREAGIDWLRADGSPGEARNPIIADFDNDGQQDILITYANDNHRLYRNVGGAHFEDVTRGSGLGGEGIIGGPAAVFDFDSDGLLDIYIAYFGNYLRGEVPTVDKNNQNALPNKLFRNLGGMRFEDVTEGSGTADVGWSQAVSHVDFDRDGRQDIIVANDYGRNAFFRNLGSGKFENAAPALGVIKAYHSMNVAITDMNDDDFPDIYISNLAMLVKDDKFFFPDPNNTVGFDLSSMSGMQTKESNMFYMSHLEQGRLVRYVPFERFERGLRSTGWSWDGEFLDLDHDGDDDLYLVNGTNDYNTFSMVYRPVDPNRETRELLLDHRRESNMLFLNEAGTLKDVSIGSGANFAANSRSTAYLDYDGDGDLDIAVNNFHAPAVFLRNIAEKRGGGWIKLRLVGDPNRSSNPDATCVEFADCGWKWFGVQVRRWIAELGDRAPSWLAERFPLEPDLRSSRDAVGARIVATLEDGTRVRRDVQAGSGYLSMNPKQLHVGVGQSRSVDVQIIWPNGERQALPNLATNASYTVRQGVGEVDPARNREVSQSVPR
ncbi:MAG: CRTAC1 family protein [Deltaproteobacteria bacterium]|jgi:hypothetical protein|nr:CRTAC1 family protein [Deltaproteobacteria bacterium]